jgi:hypothetical protein
MHTEFGTIIITYVYTHELFAVHYCSQVLNCSALMHLFITPLVTPPTPHAASLSLVGSYGVTLVLLVLVRTQDARLEPKYIQWFA